MNKDAEIRKLERELSETKTNHILHLILTLITGGFWGIVWLIVAISNNSQRNNLEDRIAILS